MRCKRFLCRPVVVLLISIWCMATNHCSLFALAYTDAGPTHSCCKKEKPEKPERHNACEGACCDSLAAPLPEAVALAKLSVGLACWMEPGTPAPCVDRDVFFVPTAGTAPPGSCSFLFIMGSSHQPMAPPAFVR